MKVLLIPDSHGWAFDFYAQGLKQFSKHDISIHSVSPQNNLSANIISDHDVVFLFSRWIWDALASDLRSLISQKPTIMWCCGSYLAPSPSAIDMFAGCTEKVVRQARELGITNIVLLREGVNTDLFKPLEKTASEKLRVGWAGNPGKELKRVHLLERLDYPVKLQTDHGGNFRIKGRSQIPMVNFYNSIDVYITLMRQNGAHGVGSTILEAMSCGLPVISTNICSTFKAVPEEWLIPSEPDDVAVKAMNEKLRLLDENRDLISKVGASNRKFVLENYSWKIISEDWDRLFEEVAAL